MDHKLQINSEIALTILIKLHLNFNHLSIKFERITKSLNIFVMNEKNSYNKEKN